MKTESRTDRTWQEDLRQFLPEPQVLAAWFVLTVAFVWFYWQTGSLWRLEHTWMQDDYQHGPFVPLFSVFLLWYRRDMIIPFTGRGSPWGLVFFGLWAAMRWASAYFNFGSLPEYSMLPFFAGLALFAGGWRGLRWAWPSVVFLVFMMPLPGDVQAFLSLPLQGIAARISVFVVQTLGIPAMSSGHVIQLTDRPLDVAKACSGLRMLMMFFAMCVGAAFLVRKPVWEKLFIVASAIPIAVLANVMRIVVTAIGCELARRFPSVMDPDQVVETVHTWAGYIIEMPAGLLFLWIELSLLSKLLISPLPERPLVMGDLLEERAPVAVQQNTRRER